MKPLVSVIIPNWNGRNYLKDCIASLEAQTYDALEIIVVDNASTDGSVEYLEQEFPRVVIFRNKTNRGFGSANNTGIQAARGEYLMMLNNDTRVQPNCVEELVKGISRDEGIGACACKIYLQHEENVLDAAGITICRDGLAIGRGRMESGDAYNIEQEIFFVSACACLLKRQMLVDIEIGGEYFDEDFFAYADETDMGWRARLAGWKCLYNPNAVVYHYHSASAGSYSAFKAFLVERNRIWVTIKNFPVPFLIAGFFYTLLRYIYQAYGALTGKGAAGRFTREGSKLHLIGILLKANFAALAGLPKMLRKRRSVMKKRRISNGALKELIHLYGISARQIALKE